ncbi:hypothetical protein DACRYDRAFT_94109 [Dacryopinax primogenitus]|uniref:NOT2/NOT3/NOT5 C-terminal domain-containing protein n=1 Tax=Dacryopinax primogenitus (strain DJM 731) TaxID=1858805 RepID=M5FY07_DACPD|nr:uncharacterized protein DACRYDRAFT_94109 [Dacryopinax primogenitus]EJU02941.1 hypothetical protein DACRYDRAFT_94109 [Dacryopinax primogenitus]
MIRSSATQPDIALLSVGGVDLTTSLNLAVGSKDDLYPTFYSPYSAPGTPPQTVEPDFTLPSCYNVQAPMPGPQKAAAFSDETLFFMFYSSPRDILQEVAAQELYNRHWRFHKDLGMWVTKEPEYNDPSQTGPGTETSETNKRLNGAGEKAVYTYWDVEKWDKERKEDVVMFDALEERQPGMALPTAATGARE